MPLFITTETATGKQRSGFCTPDALSAQATAGESVRVAAPEEVDALNAARSLERVSKIKARAPDQTAVTFAEKKAEAKQRIATLAILVDKATDEAELTALAATIHAFWP